MSSRSIVLLLLSLALPGPAAAQAPSAGPRPVRADPTEVLVHFRPGTPATVRALIARRHGGTLVKSNPVLGYDKILLTGERSLTAVREGLSAESSVQWAEPNATYGVLACTNCPQDPYLLPLEHALPTGENQWGVFKTGLPWLWQQGGGGSASVRIGIVDTGIDDFGAPHADLAPNVLPTGYDFVGQDADPTDAGAFRGHGTHVAGIAAAAANDAGMTGVAYESKLIIVRSLDCTNDQECPGTFEAIADGIQFAADQGARIINLSLGGGMPSATVRSAVHYAIARRAIVVAAAGNDGDTTLSYPAAYPEVIAVGASDTLDHVAAFSNSGPELDVVAPGTGIWSTWPSPSYKRLNGTSMASPFVAGVAAIIASRHPSMTAEEMRRYLREHAKPLQGADADRDGAGRVAFPPLEDWSDLPPPYTAARHEQSLWEWLGGAVSAEASVADPLDADHRPNIGDPQAADGADDGVFPLSYPRLPLLPAHIAPGAALDIGLSVARHDGIRYGADVAHSLHLDTFIDWDGDGVFESADPTSAEHVIEDHVENPATWGADAKVITRPIAPVGEHILGNPLRVRTRLGYGSPNPGADSTVRFGEVEDDQFVNLVEDFDTGRRPHTSGVYMVMDTWDVAPDPSPPCTHRGVFRMGVSLHPAVGAPCNGFIERINVMATPMMNWSEYTRATLSFWYCHQAGNCSPAGDFCRVRIDTSGVKHDVSPIPTSTGTMTLDLTPYVGAEVVIIEFVEQTDWNGRIAIDDIVVSAYDAQKPAAVSNLGVTRVAGTRELTLTWTTPDENDLGPSPPARPEPSTYDVRLHTSPIATAADWNAAQRVDPRDVTVGSIVPGTPGVPHSVTVRAPSAFAGYYVGLRTGDEVAHTSTLSNSPMVTGVPTLALDVLSLGDSISLPADTVAMAYRLTNLGDAPDTYAIEAYDTRGWPLLGLPTVVALDAMTSTIVELPVVNGGGSSGGDRDTITLVAWSMTDSSRRASDASVLETLGTTDAPPHFGPPLQTALGAVGPNPFRSRLRIHLTMAAGGHAEVLVHDLAGRVVRMLVDRPLPSGVHAVEWDGRDANGSPLPSGAYYLRLRGGGIEQTRTILRVR